MRKKAILAITLDFLMLSIAHFMAYYTRFDGNIPVFYVHVYIDTFALVMIIKIVYFYAFNVYRSLWRYASMQELINIVLANSLASLTYGVLNSLYHFGTPISVNLISWMMSIILMGGTRFTYRVFKSRQFNFFSSRDKGKHRVMIVGAGEAASIVISELMHSKRKDHIIVLAVDDDLKKANQVIHNVPIKYSTERIVEFALKYRIDDIIVAMPSVKSERLDDIVHICKKTSCSIQIIPSVLDIFNGKISYNLVRENMGTKMDEKIWLASPHMSDEGYEIKYVQEAFDTNWISPVGNNVTEFEAEMALKVETTSAVALVSGTSAIHMALIAADIKEGDIVFCQDLTFSASANPIVYQKGIPVFIDSDLETWNIDPKCLELAIKKYPQVKALIVVHLYGLSVDMDRIIEICSKHHIILIEDAAESLGALYKGKYTGTLGDYGIYSFNGNKIITTSGGGMLVSNNKERMIKVRSWATQSRDTARHYQHSELGFNYRMSNVVAGIGRGQLKILDLRVAQKTHIFNTYVKELSHLKGLKFMPVNDWNTPNYWLSCITLSGKIRPID
ncbi:MAG: aminotransferase class I/II-fold pyridoxal phosphate-dependent enzyme, partial [Erysipelotrichaceae bacterium]